MSGSSIATKQCVPLGECLNFSELQMLHLLDGHDLLCLGQLLDHKPSRPGT